MTAFKTLSARLRGAKTELEELGEEEDSFTESTSKLRDMVKGLTGFDIMQDEDTFKSIYEILLGIGEEWDNLTDVERASLGEALAGKRNSNVLYAVMNNIEDLRKAYEMAEDAAGSATREQENYEKSIQYSIDVLKSQVSELYSKILSSKEIKTFVDLLAQVLSYVVKIADKIPAIVTIGSMFGASAFLGNPKRMGQISMFLEGILKATGILARGDAKGAWSSLVDSITTIMKGSNSSSESNRIDQLGDSIKNLKINATALKTVGIVAVIAAIAAAVYGVSKSFDSLVDSLDEVEDRTKKAQDKVEEYDTKLAELKKRLDEINETDMSEYSYNQQQNLKKEAEYVEALTEQYEELKKAQEEVIKLSKDEAWTGDLKYNPYSTMITQLLSGDIKDAWNTLKVGGIYRGDNEALQGLINVLGNGFAPVATLNSSAWWFNKTDKNKSQLLDNEIEKYKELRQELNNLKETQIQYGDDTRLQSKIIEVNSQLAESTERIREYEAELMEMKKTILDEYNAGFEEMKKLQEGGSVDLFNRPRVEVLTKDGQKYWETVYSSTFSDEAGKRWLNFTPIMVDENGNYIGTLSSEDLQKYAEEVIKGTRTDDLHLQIGTEFSSEKSAVEASKKIHELQEQYYSGLDSLNLGYIEDNLQSIDDTFDMLDEGYASEETALDKWINRLNRIIDKDEELLLQAQYLTKDKNNPAKALLPDFSHSTGSGLSEVTEKQLSYRDDLKEALDDLYALRDILQFIQDFKADGFENAFKNLLVKWDERSPFGGNTFERISTSLQSIKDSWSSIISNLGVFKDFFVTVLKRVAPDLAEILEDLDVIHLLNPLTAIERIFQLLSEDTAIVAETLAYWSESINESLNAIDIIVNRYLPLLEEALKRLHVPDEVLELINIYKEVRGRKKDTNQERAQLPNTVGDEYYTALPEISETKEPTRFKNIGALLSSNVSIGPDFPDVTWAQVGQELAGLAQAGKLDEDTLKDYKYFNDIVNALCDSASATDDEMKEWLKTIDKIAQQNAVDILADYQTQMDKLDDSYQKFKSDELIDANTLSALQDAFGDMDSFQDFQNAVMQGEKDLQSYFDAMATEYALEHIALSEVTEDTKEWTKQQLIASGITEKSAEDSINAVLANKEATESNIRTQIQVYNETVALDDATKDLAVSTEDLDKLTAKEVSDLLAAADASGTAAEQIAIFTLKKELASGRSLRNEDDLNYLREIIIQAGVGIELIDRLQKLKRVADAQGGNKDEYDEFMRKHPNQGSWDSATIAEYNAKYADVWGVVDFEKTYDEVWKEIEDKTKEHLDYTSQVALGYGGALDSAKKSGEDAAKEFKDALDKILAMYDAELDAGVISFQTYVDKSRAIIEQYYRDGKIKAQDYYDELSSLYEKQVQQYDKVINAVQKRLKDETDALEKQKETIENSYNEQIEVIQKKIDALQEENDEIDRNLALSKAQYELERARHQRTRLLYSESRGFYYEADLKAVAEAEDNVRKAKLNKQVSEYEKQIKNLQGAMESETKAIDDQIKKLNEYSEKWGEVTSKLEDAQNALRATEVLGPDWEANILSGLTLLETFTEQYVNAQQRQKDAYLQARMAEANNPVDANGGGTVSAPSGNNNNNNNSEITTTDTSKDEPPKEDKKTYTDGGWFYDGKIYSSYAQANAVKEQAEKKCYDDAYKTAYDNAYNKYKYMQESTRQGKAAEEAEAEAEKALKTFQSNKYLTRTTTTHTYGSGTNAAQAGEALVGEFKPEIVVHKNGTASIVEEPTLMDLQGGEKIFNGEETEKILKSKYKPLSSVNPNKFKMLHAFAGGTTSATQRMIAAQAVGIASGINSGLVSTSNIGGQTINQTFNVTLPNITDASKAQDLMDEFQHLSLRAIQHFKRSN